MTMTPEDKKAARQLRERKMRRWLAGLSWTLPVFSFGTFFTVWSDIAHAHTTSSSTSTTQSTTSASTSSSTSDRVLYKAGMRSSQIASIQQQLAALGLFHHSDTGYYGSITTQSVETFQSTFGLPVTGKIDKTTLAKLQQVVRQVQSYSLGSGSDSGSSSSSGSESNNYGYSTPYQAPSSVTQSQQTVPSTSSSAS